MCSTNVTNSKLMFSISDSIIVYKGKQDSVEQPTALPVLVYSRKEKKTNIHKHFAKAVRGKLLRKKQLLSGL